VVVCGGDLVVECLTSCGDHVGLDCDADDVLEPEADGGEGGAGFGLESLYALRELFEACFQVAGCCLRDACNSELFAYLVDFLLSGPTLFDGAVEVGCARWRGRRRDRDGFCDVMRGERFLLKVEFAVQRRERVSCRGALVRNDLAVELRESCAEVGDLTVCFARPIVDEVLQRGVSERFGLVEVGVDDFLEFLLETTSFPGLVAEIFEVVGMYRTSGMLDGSTVSLRFFVCGDPACHVVVAVKLAALLSSSRKWCSSRNPYASDGASLLLVRAMMSVRALLPMPLLPMMATKSWLRSMVLLNQVSLSVLCGVFVMLMLLMNLVGCCSTTVSLSGLSPR
jgi:hypothetical protein